MSKHIILFVQIFFLTSIVKSTELDVNTTTPISLEAQATQQTPNFRVKKPLASNFTRKNGERIRLECDFEYISDNQKAFNPNDFTLYWVKNYQELMQSKKGYVHVIRKNMTSILILKKLESFDSGSYMCIGELTTPDSNTPQLNASSETTLIVHDPQQQININTANFGNKRPIGNHLRNKQRQEYTDDLLADLANDDSDLSDEFPSLSPTIVENFEDKGFCEPYKGSVCAGIITNNYSIYSTSAQQQDLIEERLKTIIPLLMSNKNNLSKRCSTFAIPSLCLFAFPLCDKQTKQPKQICRYDCKQLQQDICKNEYFNVKSLFESKLSDNLQQQSSNFLLDCNQLPPSSDSPSDCLPIVTMTLDKLESQVIALNNQNMLPKMPQLPPVLSNPNDYQLDNSIVTTLTDKKIMNLLYILVPSVCIPFILICFVLTMCYCRRNNQLNANQKLNPNVQNNILPLISQNNTTSSHCGATTNSLASNSNSNIHPSRLRMSNVSMGHKKGGQKQFYNRNGSSKSSVASSQTNNNNTNPHMMMDNCSNNQFPMSNQSKSNYDNHYLFNNNFPQPPQQPLTMQMLNQQQQHVMIQQQQYQMQMHQQQMQFQQQQQLQQQNEFTVKQISPNSIRLLQEVGKGRFGQVYTGELIGSFGLNNVQKTVIKTLNLKQLAAKNMRAYIDDITTSTPVVHNNNFESNQTAAAHFTEQEFYTEISLYSKLKNKYLANLIGVYTTNSKLNEEFKIDDNDENDVDVEDSASMITDITCQQQQTTLLPQCMIFENLNNGDLHEYLLQRASSNSAALQSANVQGIMMGSQSNLSAVSSSIGGVSSNYLSLQQQQRTIADFLYIGQQIASGMEYLASQNFVLKDLATRNILMSDNLTVKISIDLIAQYKEAYVKDYYKFQNKPLPVRWMSPESLLYGRYNQQSDVWSFGVCLWEIFNYGCQPYSGCTNPEAIEMIRDRQLLLIPDECPQRAYALMLECWHEIPMQRPTFTEILNRLRNWENYYLFNNPTLSLQQQQQQQQLMPPPPLPLPLHLQQSQQQNPPHQQFQMTTSYSSNSQNSKASSLLGNTASTGVSNGTTSSSPLPPPPSSLPPPLQTASATISSLINHNVYYSPSKTLNSQFQQQAQSATNSFASKFQSSIPSSNLNNKSSPPSSSIMSSRIYRDVESTTSLRSSQRLNGNNNIQTNNFGHLPSQMEHQYDL